MAEILKKRHYQFQLDGLGIGISNYELLEVEETIELKSVEELPLLRMRVKEALQNEIKLDGYYQAVGVYNWPTLPCVLDELSYFQKYLDDTLTFQNITPSWLLEQSVKGNLKNNRIIHFAVHGIAIPAIPELSSLVLLADASGNRYVNTDAIASLDMEADLVVLSACETGLGEIIPSIGNIGLTQSFLLAGSKSVLVSLWEIDDYLTATFIRCFYTELSSTSWNYPLALANTKRKCLLGELGEELKNPLYWAAFIWFGTFTGPQ
ncbi:MAG: CHAT domain-containing protein [Bacteroidota bacterium]